MLIRGINFLGAFLRIGFSLGILSAAIGVGVLSPMALGADIKWSGEYRVEGDFIRDFTLNAGSTNAAGATAAPVDDGYVIHHLILDPEIIAADGLKIKSRFDIFNNALATSTAGQMFGDYTGSTSITGGASPQPPAVLSGTQNPGTIAVNSLYLEWINEFSAVTVGRVPFQFGLGMTYSDGNGEFDHTLTSKDLVAYKLALGNISLMPAIGKVREGPLTQEADINDYMMVAQYENSDSGLSFGVMFDQRVAPQGGGVANQGDDMPLAFFTANSQISPNFNSANPAIYDPGGAGFSAYNMNFYVKKATENFSFAAELGFDNGYTGVQVYDTSAGVNAYKPVNLAGFGVATETTYKSGDLTYKLYAGMASGDNPDSDNYEGYAFEPNYHIAMIMFTYPVGAPGSDPLRSSLYGSRAPVNSSDPNAQALYGLDTEVITNAIYAAPSVTWQMGEHYDLIGTLAWAMEAQPSVSTQYGGSAGQIGFETDLGFRYRPSKNFEWTTTLGGFFPGQAYANVNTFNSVNSSGYPTSVAYGAQTKAAINF